MIDVDVSFVMIREETGTCFGAEYFRGCGLLRIRESPGKDETQTVTGMYRGNVVSVGEKGQGAMPGLSWLWCPGLSEGCWEDFLGHLT